MQIYIDKRIQELLTPLKKEEYEELEKSILQEGCREPIILWGNVIVDGHNRYKICQHHGKPYDFIQMDFKDFEEVKAWIYKNQLGRRNLSPEQFKWYLGELYLLKKKQHGGARKSSGQNAHLKTSEMIANEFGVNESTVRRSAKAVKMIKERAIPEVAELVKKGEINISDAIKVSDKPLELQRLALEKVQNGEEKNIRQAISRIEIKQKINNISNVEIEKPDGLYDVIVIDPPWKMKKIERNVAPEQVEMDYPTMTLEEIADLDIPSADDCHVFLWTTQKYLPKTFELFQKWGVKYVLTFVWKKNGGFQPFNLPQYNCEFVVYGHIGNPKFIDTKAFYTCFEGVRRGHSVKPDEFYDTIRRVTAGRRLDMFNRRKIEGFDGWGFEHGNN